MKHRIQTTAILSTAALIATAGFLIAGPLNPPAGPVASTHKTLTEVEPRTAINAVNTPGDADSVFKITVPGSYYLTGNITGVAGKHGIEIAASGVTVDLNGFDAVGVPGSIDGVYASVFNTTNLCVRDGSFRNWGFGGINLGNAINSSVINVRASGNGASGITMGAGSTMSGCSASLNTGSGIIASSSTITGCSAFTNTGDGINAGVSGVVTGCAVYDNGDDGIVASAGSTITQCSARLNGGDGIQVLSGCIVLANTCSGNGNSAGDGAGILVLSADNRIEGNNCSISDRGIDVNAAGNVIIKNTCGGNTVNWEIIAGNAYGPIVATPSGAAVNGNTAPAALGSTDPNANFTY